MRLTRAARHPVRSLRGAARRGRRAARAVEVAARRALTQDPAALQAAAERRAGTRLAEAVGPVREGVDRLGSVPADLQAVAAELAGLRAEATALREAADAERRRTACPAVHAWHAVSSDRREGPVCLVLGAADAAAVRGARTEPGAVVVVDLDAPAPGRASLPPAHSAGLVLLDLDRWAEAGPAALAAWAGWLRPETPVAGCTRVPAAAASRAAALSRAVHGALLPGAPDEHGLVRFRPGLAPGALADVPAPEPFRTAGRPAEVTA